MTRSKWDLMRTIRFNILYALFWGGIVGVSAFLFGIPVPWREFVGFILAIGFLAALCEELSALKAKVEQLELANSAQSKELSSLSELREELLDLKRRIPEPQFG
ncbi:MAG: hypothetical protein V3T23_10215 [Nitrososphaerales archaeon]